MEVLSQILRTLDALNSGEPGVRRSPRGRVDEPDQSCSGWHLHDAIPNSDKTYPQITRLFLQNCRQLQSFGWVNSFPNLERLWVFQSDKVSDLEGIQSATRLKSLTIWPSMSATITLNSLSPVSSLRELEEFIYAGKTRDGLLAPLQALRNLKTVFFSNSYTWQEVAGFEASHPTANFPWKGGVVPAANPSVLKCKGCGAAQSMLTGKGLRIACPQCDATYIDKHLKRYNRLLTA